MTSLLTTRPLVLSGVGRQIASMAVAGCSDAHTARVLGLPEWQVRDIRYTLGIPSGWAFRATVGGGP